MAFFMPDAHAEIDWTRGAEFLEQELRAITRKTRRGLHTVDRLAKVWLHGGTEQWVLVHIEIQSQVDQGFARRMFRYYSRATDLFEGRPIACLAVLGDDNAQWRPDRYAAGLWRTEFSFRFRVVKLLDYSEDPVSLEQSENPFARFVLAHLKTLQTQTDYESRLAWKLRIIQGLYAMGVSEAEIGSLSHDFDWLLALPEPLEANYYQQMVRFEEERAMPHMSTAERIGHKRGREEGRMEELYASILEILELKFGSVPAEIAQAVESLADMDRLRSLRKMLLLGATLSEFEQALYANSPE